MKIEIHDVDHGACALITSPHGHRLMLDCGCNFDSPWFPSITYHGQRIDPLIIQNLDEDHVEDLKDVWRDVRLGAVFSNPTVSAAALEFMKDQGMRSGVKQAHAMLQAFGSGKMGSWDQWLGGVSWQAFYNPFGGEFHDTNNLSLAVFVSFGGFTILFGGDMEEKGWKNLLRIPAFVARLAEVQVYVASHHGRDNGCCDPLMEYMKPELVIFSDGSKQHRTQETTGWYAQRARGIPDYGRQTNGLLGPRLRKVMTTRKDGTLTIDVQANGAYWVRPSRQTPAYGQIQSRLLPALPPLQPPVGLSALARFTGHPTTTDALEAYFAAIEKLPQQSNGLAALSALEPQSPLVSALLGRR
jgi:beta-lactamase superfamily II metal-dependent hydrolase